MVKQFNTRANHHTVGNGENLAVHHELLILGELHEDDPEVGASQVKREELALLFPIRQLLYICWKTFDRCILVVLPLEPHVDGVPHLLLQHVDVVIVQHQVSHKVFNQPG